MRCRFRNKTSTGVNKKIEIKHTVVQTETE